jgi:hypothetical protein
MGGILLSNDRWSVVPPHTLLRDGHPIDLAFVERIEVIHGSSTIRASALARLIAARLGLLAKARA